MTFYLEESDMRPIIIKTIFTALLLLSTPPSQTYAQSVQSSPDDIFDVSPQEEQIARQVYGDLEQEATTLECRIILETATEFIKDHRKHLKPEFARALSASINMQSRAPARGRSEPRSHIKPENLDICLKVNAEKQKIGLLKKAIAGTLPASPLDTIQQCGAGLYVLAWAYESLHSESDAPYHFGVQIGGEIGRISTIVKYLYKGYDDLDEQSLSRLEEEFVRYRQADTNSKRTLLKRYVDSCETLGIPFQSYAKKLPYALRPPIHDDLDFCYCPPGPLCSYIECPINRWAGRHDLSEKTTKLIFYALLFAQIKKRKPR